MEETIDYKGFRIEIVQDEHPSCPRTEWDPMGHMVCFHRRYNLGEKHYFDSPEDFQEWIKGENAVVLPLYLYDHSGITMNTSGFSCGWDSGQVGWIYVTLEDVRKQCGYDWKRWTKARREKAAEWLRGEVRVYDDYLTGNVWGFITYDEHGDMIDSCHGFYGDTEYCIEEAKSVIDYEIKHRLKQRLLKLKTLIKSKVPIYLRSKLMAA